MDRDPQFKEVLPVVAFSDQLLPSWLKALNSGHLDLERKAAESIVIVKSRGLQKHEAVHQALLKKFGQEDLHRQVRVAVAKAIVALDLKAAEADFVRQAETSSDPELQAVIQTALANWKSSKALDLWKKNAVDPALATRLRILAIQGLTSVRDSTLASSLMNLLEDQNADFRLRFAAADMLKNSSENLEITAKKLFESGQLTRKLLAVKSLAGKSAGEMEILKKAAADAEPAVAFVAWSTLLQSDSARELDAVVDIAMKNRGAKVRRATIDLLHLWKSPQAAEKIGELLADVHPDVRIRGREILIGFAADEDLRPAVIQAAVENLDANWQGIQQGILILAKLDHKSSAEKIMSLLDHPRAEVHITAGWALEQLSVEKTLQPIFERVEKKIESKDYLNFSDSEHERIGHLIQLLGKNKHKPMERVIIRKLIPKDMRVLFFPTRPAAFWSLGQIYQGQELPEDFKKLLLERLHDDDPMNPESSYVKSMCVLTFAVTNSKSTISSIEEYAELNGSNSRFGFYCDWGLNQLDGRAMPVVEPFRREDSDWFLYPLK